VWDFVTYTLLEASDADAAVQNGKLAFRLNGKRLQGGFSLVRMKGKDPKHWLMIKKKDAFVQVPYRMVPVLNPK